MKGFQCLTPIDEAWQTLFRAVNMRKLKVIAVPLSSALNRVLAEDIVAQEDLPRFNKSAVDGYALRAQDSEEASQFKPKLFKITDGEVIRGHTKQIWTGNPLPEGANAVVMLEDTRRVENQIEVWATLRPFENVSKKGEDVAKGETAIKAGTRLKPHHLGLLNALGWAQVQVYAKPKVAIMATGNELVELGVKLQANQIFESNRTVLSALCSELGSEPLDFGIVKDDVEEISEKIRSALKEADVVITTGGTSTGASDFVPEAVNRIGKPGVVVHGIAMRPAMPTALAAVDGKPVLILSGNPVAAMIGFEVFARPLISRLLGLRREEPRPWINAKTTRKMAAVLGRKTFIRVRVVEREGELFAEPVSAKGSGLISTMTKANGYVVVPENCEGLGEGETVTVFLFDSIEAH
ncbi:MAG: molybdopterin molybdotransferase MoeA [Candidatus Bathyarchaeota archaeon]|nr:molybdopterin molybdotransferase MoeA [Candidatus Bathyarchaeota archaeon]